MARKTAKRENGAGSVHKRKDSRSRPWVAVSPAKYDLNGKAKRTIIGHFATSKEAKEALLQYNQCPSDKFNITVAEAYQEWSEIAFRNISKQMQNCYSAAFKKIEAVYDIKLRELRTSRMQKVIDAHFKLSRSSLSKIKILFSQLLDYGLENDVVNKNYAQFLVLPKETAAEKECFTDIELKKIENAVDTVPFADIILAMCYTGFRISEFIELTPFSYNAENGTLTGGKKTEAGKNRVVPVHPKIVPIVSRWLAKNGQTIFCQDNGKQYGVKAFRDRFYAALEEIGIRKLTPHATRHTFATKLAAAGARAEDIQKILGHASYDMTASVYIHQNVDSLKNAVNLVR